MPRVQGLGGGMQPPAYRPAQWLAKRWAASGAHPKPAARAHGRHKKARFCGLVGGSHSINAFAPGWAPGLLCPIAACCICFAADCIAPREGVAPSAKASSVSPGVGVYRKRSQQTPSSFFAHQRCWLGCCFCGCPGCCWPGDCCCCCLSFGWLGFWPCCWFTWFCGLLCCCIATTPFPW